MPRDVSRSQDPILALNGLKSEPVFCVVIKVLESFAAFLTFIVSFFSFFLLSLLNTVHRECRLYGKCRCTASCPDHMKRRATRRKRRKSPYHSRFELDVLRSRSRSAADVNFEKASSWFDLKFLMLMGLVEWSRWFWSNAASRRSLGAAVGVKIVRARKHFYVIQRAPTVYNTRQAHFRSVRSLSIL